jgi:hypothetical protein
MVQGEIQLGLHLPSGIIHNAAGDQNAAIERISKQFFGHEVAEIGQITFPPSSPALKHVANSFC